MQSIWKITFFQLVFSLASTLHAQGHQNSLIGEDFGLLTKDDLAINTCTALPVPFSSESKSFPYWQCFPVMGSSVECDGREYDPHEKSELTILAFVVRKEGKTHEYLSRHAIPLGACHEYQNIWRRLTQHQEHVCIRGPLIRIESRSTAAVSGHWIFDAFKTRAGCDSYFAGGCSLSYLMQEEGCVPLR